MTIKTEYICDLCQAVAHDTKQFWHVAVHVGSNLFRADNTSKQHELHCCRNCLETRLGIHVQTKTKETPGYIPPTVEDIIIDIVQNAILQARMD